MDDGRKKTYTLEQPPQTNSLNSSASSQKESLSYDSAGSEYDPYMHRDVHLPTNNLETLLHVIKGIMGSGILAMPDAFKNAGYAFGFFATIVIGIIQSYCVHQLVRSAYILSVRKKVPSMTYPETAREAMLGGPRWMTKLAPYASPVVNIFVFAFQLGTCCVYFVFISSNIKRVCDIYFDPIDVRIYMCFVLGPIILINLVRNLKYLAPFSALSNLTIVSGLSIILYYVFRDGLPPLEERQAVGDAKGIPLFFGTVLFALTCIGMIMPLENNMKTPKRFGGTTGVFNRAMIVIMIIYTGFGLLGFLKYGPDVQGSITLNLPADEKLAQAVQLMIAVAVFMTYPLQCYVAIDILWTQTWQPKLMKRKVKYLLPYEIGVRVLLVLIPFGLAVAIPNLELFISLVGALTLSIVAIALPPIIEIATFEHQRRGWRLIKNIALFLFGLLGLVTGTAISVIDIVNRLFT
ncbi:proton-coupled amino acid transporter-like protein CG1139 isoform X2 [Neocloeon triangulifer]|nr:proton-coupled amino acid transporter-like protein CG1139 isoform X2 [Neocloeon triangulifer]XP_059483179.1 proton-coupled amino acid transporter-like protein CG1139 isoform X2 [Neocloeon triangulifer]